jgi:hypothetical protein
LLKISLLAGERGQPRARCLCREWLPLRLDCERCAGRPALLRPLPGRRGFNLLLRGRTRWDGDQQTQRQASDTARRISRGGHPPKYRVTQQ